MKPRIDDKPDSEAQIDPSEKYRARKRQTIKLLFAYAALSGILVCFLPEEDTALDTLVGVPFLILSIAWCFFDSFERGYRISLVIKVLLIVLFVIGFPLYLFRTRGWRAFKTLVIACLIGVAVAVCSLISTAIMLVVGDALGLWEMM